MESVVVTGSRIASESDSVTVRDRHRSRFDRAAHGRECLDLLRSVAGVHIAQAGGRSGFASLPQRWRSEFYAGTPGWKN